jgi:hypothetical protein
MSIEYDVVASDHRPIGLTLDAKADFTSKQVAETNLSDAISINNWGACSVADRCNYAIGLDKMLQAASMPPLCCVKNCSDAVHRRDIDIYLQSICECIKDAANAFIPHKRVKISEYTVAGWNDIVSDKHDASRQAFMDWVYDGKPRMGHVYEAMKRARAQFKLAVRYCKNNEELLRNNQLANNFLADKNKFWRKVKNISNCKVSKSATNINGANSDDAVTDVLTVMTRSQTCGNTHMKNCTVYMITK